MVSRPVAARRHCDWIGADCLISSCAVLPLASDSGLARKRCGATRTPRSRLTSLAAFRALIGVAILFASQFAPTADTVALRGFVCIPCRSWRPQGGRHAEASTAGAYRAAGPRVENVHHSDTSSRRQLALGILALLTASSASRARAAGADVVIKGIDGSDVRISGAKRDSDVAQALDNVKWSPAWPYTERDFARLDADDDAVFYTAPRLVKHVDDKALAALTAYYKALFPKGKEFAALDICSSWVSHYPQTPRPARFAITGMNKEELSQNRAATEYVVSDLNKDPKLPYGDQEFDVVTNTVSVDYLTRPREVFSEVARVLRPGGVATVAFSDRCFLSKVVAIWSSADDADRAELVASYFHYAGGFRDVSVVDISPGGGNPMYVVSAVKA